MKTPNLWKRLAGIGLMTMVMATLGWGACSGTQTGTWTTSTATYSKTGQSVQSDAADYYVITVPTAGPLNLTIDNTDSAQDLTATLYPNGSCSSTSLWSATATAGHTATTSQNVAAGTYTVSIVGSASNKNTDYDLSGTFGSTSSYASSNERPFTLAYSANAKGDITIIGNSSTCKDSNGNTSGGTCTEPTSSDMNHQIYTMFYKLSADASDSSIFNSSSSTLTLPAGRNILWAGLYWMGAHDGGSPSASIMDGAKTVKIKAPGQSAYTTVNSIPEKFNWNNQVGNYLYYQGVADITSLVKNSGDGDYRVANVYSTIGAPFSPGGNLAVWSIVVVYEDDTATLKNLSVFDGYGYIGTGKSVSATVSGFLTPAAGNVASKLVVFTGEGDINPTSDKITMTNKAGGVVNLGTNNMNSTVNDANGSNVLTRTPNWTNTIGADIDTYEVGVNGSGFDIIGNSQTSTTITLSTSDDVYNAGVFAFSTDIYQPFIAIKKSANTSGALAAGQVIAYTADINNSGNENAENIVIYDNFDENILSTTSGNLTNPLITLGDLLNRDSAAIGSSIVCNYGPLNTDCRSSCTVTASPLPLKVSCSIPFLAVGETAKIKFNVKVATNPDTQGQDVEVENKMYAAYSNALTKEAVPESYSNPASAGQYLHPIYYNNTSLCNLFPTPLTTFNHLTVENNGIYDSCTISFPTGAFTDASLGNGQINNPNSGCHNTTGDKCTCDRVDPVAKYSPTLYTTTDTATTTLTGINTLTDLYQPNLNLSGTVTFSPSQSYSDNARRLMLIGDMTNVDASTMTFNEGDYYIKSWNILGSGNSRNNIKINGNVRIFIAGDFVNPTNNVDIAYADSSATLFVYVGGDMNLTGNGGGNAAWRGFFYVKGNYRNENNAAASGLTGGITAEGTITFTGQNYKVTYDAERANRLGGEICSAPVITLVSGAFDAMDLSRWDGSSVSDRNISTKISNQNFNLLLVSLNSTKTATEIKPAGVKAYYRLYDFTANTNRTNYSVFDAHANASVTVPFNAIATATKNMRVEFKYCTDYNGTGYVLRPDTDAVCSGKPLCPQTTATTITCYRQTFSTDAFSIRPEKLELSSTEPLYPNLLKASNHYNFTIKGVDYGSTTPTQDYNVTSANSVFTLTSDKYNKNNLIDNTMHGTATFMGGDFDILNGISVQSGVTGDVAGMTFDDVGKIEFHVKDTLWSEIDNNDTAQDCSGTWICGDKNVTFIPDHFDFNTLTISNNDGANNTFTYLANEVAQMSGRIDTQIRALNSAGAVTQNFAADPLWENAVTVTPVVVVPAYLHPNANETTINNLLLGFGAGTKTIPWNEANVLHQLRFNFQRDVNLPANPFTVNGANLNISVTSPYADGGNAVTIGGNRNATATGTAQFVYGRFIPRDVRVFGDTVPFSANGWYEVFNAPILGVTALAPSRNEDLWNINSLHNDASDGNGIVSIVAAGGALPPNGASLGGIETYNFVPYAIGGYKAHMSTSPWLWYGANALPYANPSGLNIDCLTHPCFNISISPVVGTSGSAKYGSETTKASKSTTSEVGGAWRSTIDYAPAIR